MGGHYAVFGHPVAHSLSPRIHAAFARQAGIALEYTAIDAAPAEFATALDAFAAGGGIGANVTLPLKEAAFALCRSTSERARRAGAVNTLARDGDGWRGDNTDGVGLVQSAIAVSFAVWVCGLSIDGSIWLLFAVAVADALLGTTLGLLASAFARTEFQAVQFMPALVFPQILLGGIFVPRSQMPDVLHAIGDWLPLSHAIDALDAVANGTHDDAWVWTRIAFLGAWIVGAVIVGALTLRRRTA